MELDLQALGFPPEPTPEEKAKAKEARIREEMDIFDAFPQTIRRFLANRWFPHDIKTVKYYLSYMQPKEVKEKLRDIEKVALQRSKKIVS